MEAAETAEAAARTVARMIEALNMMSKSWIWLGMVMVMVMVVKEADEDEKHQKVCTGLIQDSVYATSRARLAS